jgi:hypothetical protein
MTLTLQSRTGMIESSDQGKRTCRLIDLLWNCRRLMRCGGQGNCRLAQSETIYGSLGPGFFGCIDMGWMRWSRNVRPRSRRHVRSRICLDCARSILVTALYPLGQRPTPANASYAKCGALKRPYSAFLVPILIWKSRLRFSSVTSSAHS